MPAARKDLLSGIRVLDLTRATAGPFATQILGDLGAEIIKIEAPPHRSYSRDSLGMHKIDGLDLPFVAVNRGKKSVVLDLANPAGRDTFYELVAVSNVVIDNFRPGVTKKLQLDHERLISINPSIITASLSGYGADGPLADRAGFDVTVQAQAGMSSFNGFCDASGEPIAVATGIADLVGGLYLAIAVQAAIIQQLATASGSHIDVAMYDALLSLYIGFGLHELNFGEPSNLLNKMLWGNFRARDRTLVLAAHRDAQFAQLCRAIGRPELVSDARFADAASRMQNFETLKSLIEHEIEAIESAELVNRFQEQGVAFAELLTVAEAFRHEHTAAREMIAEVRGPHGSPIKIIGSPMKFAGRTQHYAGAPQLGADTEPVLQQLLGYNPDRLAELRKDGAIYSIHESVDGTS